MGYDNHNAPRHFHMALDQFHDFDSRFRVQRGGRFITDDQRGFMDERSSDGDTLLLSSGQVPRRGIKLAAKATSSSF